MMAEDCGRGPVVSYVPNEVCVVIAAERLDDPAAAYEAARADLNALLPRLRRQRRPKDALERDLTPGDDFWRALEAGGEVLRPLRRGDGQAPWAVLPTDEGATSSAATASAPTGRSLLMTPASRPSNGWCAR